MSAEVKKNVLGGVLQSCCHSPKTGYFRDGYCRTDDTDFGSHVICAEVTSGFLEFSKSRGNDLITPRPEYNFPGLSPGDRWCVCALRWKEAWEEGLAPAVILEACDEAALRYITLEILKDFAIKPSH
ncbi:MAG: DUF2237 domain-containing protein [Hyphomicrobiales bacterium]|nr:hypothetical protein [Rhodobiaceae bacterium]OUT82030.1 MAG: hypothetical protein CBB88_04555 [Rhizobiales bacterium TMED28]RZO33940.1 MAG: DUF2237 domain-containing protein [Hyphomicrobiales bacterium]